MFLECKVKYNWDIFGIIHCEITCLLSCETFRRFRSRFGYIKIKRNEAYWSKLEFWNLKLLNFRIVNLLVCWLVRASVFFDVDVAVIMEKSKFKTIKI
jgi:hypothetical protein